MIIFHQKDRKDQGSGGSLMRTRTISRPGSWKGVCRPSEGNPGDGGCAGVPAGPSLAQVEAGRADAGQSHGLKPHFQMSTNSFSSHFAKSWVLIMYEIETRIFTPQEIMNHCFDDVERFMARLQQAAEAQHLLSQKTKKRSKKSNKKGDPGGESCTSF